MSPRDQKAMEQIYAFLDLQTEILTMLRTERAREEVRRKVSKLMRMATTVRRIGGMRYMGGVDPVASAQELKVLVAA